MSMIQPQMNTASFASLAGSPKASAGEAPQGLDFLTILAGSQAARGAGEGAAPVAGAIPALTIPTIAGNTDGSAGGKILPGSENAFAASHTNPALPEAKRFAEKIERVASKTEPAIDALLAKAEPKSHTPRGMRTGTQVTIDLDADPAADAQTTVEAAPDATPLVVLVPAFEAPAGVAAKLPLDEAGMRRSGREPSRLASEGFAKEVSGQASPDKKVSAPVPAALAPLVADAMEAIDAAVARPLPAAGQLPLAAAQPPVAAVAVAQTMAASRTAPRAPDEATSRLRAEPVRASETAAIALDRAMGTSPAISVPATIPAASLIAARVAQPSKLDVANDGPAPVQPAVQSAIQPAADQALATTAGADGDTDPLQPAASAPRAVLDTAVSNTVFNPAGMVQDTTMARPAVGTVATQIDNTVQPQDFETLVGRLAEAREAASPNLVRAAINHAEFGQISLAFRADESRLAVTMTGSDPALAPAVLAAASAAQAAGNDSAAREQSAQNQQQNQQQAQQNQQHQASGHAAQSGLGNAAQGQADRQNAEGRGPSTDSRNSGGNTAAETTSEAPDAPRSNPPGIYA